MNTLLITLAIDTSVLLEGAVNPADEARTVGALTANGEISPSKYAGSSRRSRISKNAKLIARPKHTGILMKNWIDSGDKPIAAFVFPMHCKASVAAIAIDRGPRI